jgi:glycosyltransferase involved in cell wall biosynthesis
MKKILINLLPFRNKDFNGNENYVKGILSELNDDHYLVFLYQSRFPLRDILPTGYKNYTAIKIPINLNPFFRILIEQLLLTILSFYFQLIYSPCNAGVILGRRNCRSVITIHDMLPFNNSCKYSVVKKFYIKFITRLSFNSADLIITVSNSTKNNIISKFGDNKKIEVIYNSVTKHEIDKESKKNSPFFLIIGGINKDKNVDKVIIGFKLFLENNKILNDLSIKLYIIGANQGYLSEVLLLIESLELSDNVIYLGYISNLDKERLLSGCVSLFMMGNEEGFGIPALELLQHHKIPIITSKGALLEVCDKFSIQTDSDSPQHISEAIAKALYAPPSFSSTELDKHLLKFNRKRLSTHFIQLIFSDSLTVIN